MENKYKSLSLFLLLVVCLFFSTNTANSQESSGQLFEKALYTEEVKGELQNAIDLYQQILTTYPEDRQITAKSLFQMGICYEKLGSQEAKKAYQRIIQEFTDQKEVVTEARTRLAALEKPTGPEVAKGLVVRQVWAGPGVDALGTPSPDGRYLSYTDWETGDLAIRELATGKTRRLTGKGTQEQPSVFALNSVISPDNKHVAYSWTNEYGTYDLYVIGIDGSGNRILYSSEDKDEVYPASWSPDGKQIAARRYSASGGEKFEIISIAVADGSVQVIKTFEEIFWPYFCYSPDDRFIAYDFPVEENSGNHDISLISIDGSGETSLIKHPANDRLLGWAPGRNEILFLSDRFGTFDAWIIEVDNGKPLGAPKRIRPNLGQVSPMAFTKNGSYYFNIYTRKYTTQIAPFDLKTGNVQEQLSKTLLGSNFAAGWSPDGEYLTYVVEQTEVAGPGWYHRPLHVLNLGTGEEQELTVDFEVRVPRWSPDGNSILFTGYNNKKSNQKDYNGGVYKIDIQSGHVTELLQFPPVEEPSHDNFFRDVWWGHSIADWAHDGNGILYVNRGRIILRELESGREKELYRNNDLRKLLDLSPDGKRLVFGIENSDNGTWSIMIMPISGGEPRELLEFHGSKGIDIISWTPDGEYVLYTEKLNKISALWRISPEGGEPLKIWQPNKIISGLSIHPEGQQIAFSTYEQDLEIWVMDNFLPEIKATR